ncbi:uncharacterized protein LOC141648583 [Silene latifolia]|uniref:uncharacterized protein LOC141648583 n=1 Tax=Silene latifolia TaxID=37657 RepID=UPI003D77B224
MAFSNNIIFVASIFILLSTSFLRVDSDQGTDKLCGATEAPSLCTTCVKKHVVRTDLDVIEAMLNCANDDAHKIKSEIEDITTRRAKIEVRLKSALLQCIESLTIGYTEGTKAGLIVAQRKLGDASNLITSVVQNLSHCQIALSDFGPLVPTTVSSGLFTVDAEYKVVLRLVDLVPA